MSNCFTNTIFLLVLLLLGNALLMAADEHPSTKQPPVATIDIQQVGEPISPYIYGQFIEHLGRCIYGGIWAEMLEDRKFYYAVGKEESPWELLNAAQLNSFSAGARIDNGRVVLAKGNPLETLVFGDQNWQDYEFSLEAKKNEGTEGFLIIFRNVGKGNLYWYNFGGWNNSRHGLERDVNGQRSQPAGKGQAGQIETDLWYKIRVKCKGPQLQVWLNDKEMVDFTDEQHPHLSGRVGLGTWRTAAQFRNLKVTSLDGNILFEGLPEYKSFMTGNNAYVGEHSVEISPGKSEPRGIRQSGLALRKGKKYKGRVVLAGSATVDVSLVWGNAKNQRQTITINQLTEQYKKYPLQFTATTDSDDASLEIVAQDQGNLRVGTASLMPADNIQGMRPDTLDLLKQLNSPVYRWPGGNFVSGYDWKDGLGDPDKRPPPEKSSLEGCRT